MLPLLLLASVLVGVVVGLVGVGGGILLLPFLIHFDFTLQQAVAISLFLNAVPNTLPAVWMYYKQGHLRWRPAVLISIATVIGIVLGGYMGSRRVLSDRVVYRLYTTLVFLVGAYMFVNYC